LKLPGRFYVTVRDAKKVGFLLGPYDDFHEADANVDRARGLARKADPWAAFYGFGVARDPGPARATVFGR
jgi:hypothetical protein